MDEILSLRGDEECGVDMVCRLCDTGGRPVVYYVGYGVPNPYPVAEVPSASTITELVALGEQHIRDVHSAV
ncbi:MAG TPA: hypothetical protein VGJ95_06825 [Pseudonocardiaceae bacterium]